MGRIKSTMIKKAARQLLEGENKFEKEFETNKKILGSSMPSKSMRNKIAGYISRLKTMEQKKKIKSKEVEVSMPKEEPIQPELEQ